MRFQRATTGWKPCESLGSFYRLVEGALFVAPMNADGSMDSANYGEVEFYNLDAELALKLKLIGTCLAHPTAFEGIEGDILPLACLKCCTRFGDACEHLKFQRG